MVKCKMKPQAAAHWSAHDETRYARESHTQCVDGISLE